MTRLARLLLLMTWFFGAVAGGVTIRSGPPDRRETARVEAVFHGGYLTVRPENIAFAVRVSRSTCLRMTAPVPAGLTDWFRRSSQFGVEPQEKAVVRDT